MGAYPTSKRGIRACRRFAFPQRAFSRWRMVPLAMLVGMFLGDQLCRPCLAQESWEAAGLEQLKQAEKHVEQAGKEYDAALELCKEVARWHPKLEARAKFLMAQVYLKKGKWDDAAREANRLAKEFPESEEGLRALKLIYQAHIAGGNPKGAEKWFLPLVEGVFVPAGRGDEALERLANIYLGMREYDNTLATATRLINEYPGSAEVNKAVSYIFAVYRLQGGGEAGLARMQEFISVHPETYLASCAQYQIAGLYRRAKDRTRAIEELEKLVREYPDSPLCPRVQREIGQLYYHEKDFDRAIAATRNALEQFEPSPREKGAALRQLAALYAYNKEYDKAIGQYQTILQTEGLEDKWYRFAESFIAYCYQEKGEYERAVEFYTRLIAKYPAIGDFAAGAHYHIGYICSLQGQHEEALKAYRRILDDYPDSSWVSYAEKEIARIETTFAEYAR